MLTLLIRFLYTLPLVFIGWLGSMPSHATESSAVAIAAGQIHTCAITTAGGVKCWGSNHNSGQLGDNSRTDRWTPVDVVGLASGVAAIATGGYHTCALTTAGGVKCWGGNYWGSLGDNTTTNRLTPVDVVGLASGVAAIATGSEHTCALTTAGGVKCWGYNGLGQLGDNTNTSRLTPVDVAGLASGVAAIAAGHYHTCALTTAGGVKCWGRNNYGGLGDNTTTDRWIPVDVTGLAIGVAAISAGALHTCALTTAGAAKCWGNNYSGKLGDNTITDRWTPVNVVGLASGVAAIAASSHGHHTCAFTTAGGAKCWGDNFWGQLGDNTQINRSTPVNVVGLSSGVAGIATGMLHTCALTTAGGVKCWGDGAVGLLGDNTYTMRLTPVDVVGLGGGTSTVPSAPTAVSVTTGNGNAVITFTAPANTGSSPITSYTATSSPGGLTGSCTAPCSSITINGLTNNLAYTFTVTATNAAGPSAPSAALSSVTPTVQGIDHVPRVQRAFVASNGLDTNIAFNCDITHRCRTFYTAVAAVNADGEVVATNSAAYGTVTLTRSISLVAAPGVYAGMSVLSGATGVTIATPGINVVLRGLTINGQGGTTGVLMSAGAKLSIENCVISNFNGAFQYGVLVYPAATVRVVDTLVRDNEVGMAFLGGAMVNISRSKLLGNDSGILVLSAAGITSTIAISNSVIAGGGTGIDVSSSTSGNAQINIVRSAVTNNAVKGIVASATTGIASITLNKSLVAGNAIGFYKGAGGTLNSLGNNTITDNGSNTGTLTLITPK